MLASTYAQKHCIAQEKLTVLTLVQTAMYISVVLGATTGQRFVNTEDADADVVTCSLWSSYAMSAVQNNLDMRVRYIINDESTTYANLPTYNNASKPDA